MLKGKFRHLILMEFQYVNDIELQFQSKFWDGLFLT